MPVSRTVSRIEEMLAEAGASAVSKNYTEGSLIALSFCIETPSRKTLTIRLPANAQAVYDAMAKEVRRPRKDTAVKLREQAQRTAWKLMQDWVAVQLSLIQMQQADVLQVFLPYVWDGEQTFYERLKGSGFKQLPMSTGS